MEKEHNDCDVSQLHALINIKANERIQFNCTKQIVNNH